LFGTEDAGEALQRVDRQSGFAAFDAQQVSRVHACLPGGLAKAHDDLHAFSRAFELPITLFLTPPQWAPDAIGHAGGGETSSRADYLDLIFNLPEPARERLLKEVIELSAPTTRMLRRWRTSFATVVDERQRAVELAGFEIREEES
jgi:hypothetical protein